MRNLHCEEGWIQELQVPNLPDTADVTLLCSDNKKFYAHSVSVIVGDCNSMNIFFGKIHLIDLSRLIFVI